MNERRDWAPVDWSPMKRLIYLRGNGATGGGGSPLTVTGATPLLMPGALSKPMRKATFQISPVQSGSGDPSPSNIRSISGHQSMTAWVTGRNLLNINRTQGVPNPADYSGLTKPRVMNVDNYFVGLTIDNYYYPSSVVTDVSGNAITITSKSGGYGVGFPIAVIAGQEYTVSGIFDKARVGFSYYDKNWNYLSYGGAVISTATITIPTNCAYCVLVISSSTVNITGTITNLQFTPGSTASPYTPYSGSTVSVEFPAMGRNLYKATFPTTTKGGVTLTNNGDGSYTLNGTATNDVYFDIFKDVDLPNGSYKMTGCPAGGSTSSYYMYVRPSYTGDYGSGCTVNNNIIGGSIFVKSGYVVNNLTFWPMIQLADGAVNTFEPYTSIVYSGTIDPVTGEGVVTHDALVFDNAAWSFTSDFFYRNVIASGQNVSGYYTTENGVKMYVNGNNGQARIYLGDNSFLTSETDVGELLDGMKLLYPLATPIPFTLTPQTLTPPAGDAYIWADCGGSAEVTYIGKA